MLGQHLCFLITERGISFKRFAVLNFFVFLVFVCKMFTRLNKYFNINFNTMFVFLLMFLNFHLPNMRYSYI